MILLNAFYSLHYAPIFSFGIFPLPDALENLSNPRKILLVEPYEANSDNVRNIRVQLSFLRLLFDTFYSLHDVPICFFWYFPDTRYLGIPRPLNKALVGHFWSNIDNVRDIRLILSSATIFLMYSTLYMTFLSVISVFVLQ